MRLTWLSLLLSLSCTKYAHFEKEAFALEIKGVEMEISHHKEHPWRVGQKREKVVSQSFSFIIDLPRLKSKDLDYLIKERDIDSWVLRILSEKGGQLQDLGSVYVPFERTKLTRGTQQSITTSVSFVIQYAAAYASERFRMFKCPAFRHSKKITSLDIEGDNDEFSLQVGQAFPYKEKVDAVELKPKSFNGGTSLKGNYFIEIAPFNQKKKLTLGNFKRTPMYITVESEKEISVSSCAGTRSESE